MRIAFVINQFPPYITSGLGRYVELISPHLAEDHQLDVFTLNDGRQSVTEQVGAITVYRPLGRIFGAISRRRRLNRTRRVEFLVLAINVLVSNLRYVRRLRRTPAAARPDLVAVHDSTNFLCGLLCHYLLRLPVVFHVHTTEYGVAKQRTIRDPVNVFAAIERWLARVSRRVVVATPEVRTALVAAGWPEQRIEVVPLGGTFERVLAAPDFDRPRLRDGAAALRQRLGIATSDPVLLFVGRLEGQKGIYPLLAAMRQVVDAVPGARLVMVGEGDVAGVRRIAAETGLAGHVVTATEFISGTALLEFYELADVCVFPSLFEPFGLVATEAMAMAKPTILGDGFSRIFADDPAHPAVEFVRSEDPADIARAAIALLTSPDLRTTLSQRGEHFVRTHLSWSRAAANTVAVYASALASPGVDQGQIVT